MATLLDQLDREAADLLDEVIDLRRAIHRDPELGLANPRTRDRVIDALQGLDLQIRTGPAHSTWMIADLVGGPGPGVLLRADTDALPMTEDTGEPFRSQVTGAAHACGHDAHTAMLVGAAKLLAARRDQLAGTVRFVFQPGEEGFGGAKELVAAGATEGIGAAFALHITPNIPAGLVSTRPGPLMAAADEVLITVHGEGGHASTPHLCVDPITVAAELVGALQSMITRELNALDTAVLSIGRISAGTTNNVIPEQAELQGTVRTFSAPTRSHVHDAVRRVTAGICAAHRCTADVEIIEGYPVTANNPDSASFVAETVAEVLGEGRYFEMPFPVMGAEDFSYFLQQVPGAMSLLGVCPEDITDSLSAPPCHSNRMRLHEPAMSEGVATLAGLAVRWLEANG